VCSMNKVLVLGYSGGILTTMMKQDDKGELNGKIEEELFYDGDDEDCDSSSNSSTGSDREFRRINERRQHGKFSRIRPRAILRWNSREVSDPLISIAVDACCLQKTQSNHSDLASVKHIDSIIKAVFRQKPRTTTVKIEDENDEQDDTSIMSSHHLMLEDAVFFSPLPRVVIEAGVPHRVVHANAAYAFKYGNHTSLFEAPAAMSNRQIQVAARQLFQPSDSIIIHPISKTKDEGDSRFITHFMIQATSEPVQKELQQMGEKYVYEQSRSNKTAQMVG